MRTIEIETLEATRQRLPGYRVASRESETVRKVEQSVAYMLRHLNEPLQVATLAARVNISPSRFFAVFKSQMGHTPIDYFIRLRMQYARYLLDETMLSVKEIAATLGYDDPFYFSRIFKSVNRTSPSGYRLLGRNSKEPARDCRINLSLFRPPAPGQPGPDPTSAPRQRMSPNKF
jgi:transcriptional regulator GlxA family with amidase domain